MPLKFSSITKVMLYFQAHHQMEEALMTVSIQSILTGKNRLQKVKQAFLSSGGLPQLFKPNTDF